MSAGHLSQDEVSSSGVEAPCTIFEDEGYLSKRLGSTNRHAVSFRNQVSVNEEYESPTHEDDQALMPLIIRATNGKSERARDPKVKMSTIVQPNDIDNFYIRYADICKSGMAALKPRDRSKKKSRAKKKKAV
ncbi:hypothetical protein E4U55_001149 [Claviceps digitariae]|nr:hypothetical protein E4U55_001149 [Claviceps digitariae]